MAGVVADRRNYKKVVIILAIAGILLLFIALGLRSLAVIVTTSEERLQAFRYILAVVEAYVHEKKKWPESWADLESVDVPPFGKYQWPDDASQIRQHIIIDFSLTLDELIKHPEKLRDSIKQRSPSYEVEDQDFGALRKTINEAMAVQNKSIDDN